MKIGLVGTPGSGKDDVIAHVLVKHYGFKGFAFANKIKELYYKKIGITDEYFKSVRGTDEEETIRSGLWSFSDKKRAECGNLYFINNVMDEVLQCENAVITDIRTEDEFNEVSKIADRIIVVISNLDDISVIKSDEHLRGTRIPLYKLNLLDVFFNLYNNYAGDLEYARESFNEYYQGKLEENNGS